MAAAGQVARWWMVVAVCSLWLAVLEAQLAPEWALFEDFMAQHERTYRNDPRAAQERFRVFQESLRRHERLNAYEAEHGGTAVYGVNKFSDLTTDEFRKMYLSGIKHRPLSPTGGDALKPTKIKDLPQKFDWRKRGVINGVRNQDRCGSCWAFAVVETLESKYAIDNNGTLYQLSPQQLLSCDYNTTMSLYGCQGGVLDSAFITMKDQRMTIVKDSVFPFVSGDGKQHPCRSPLPNVGVQLRDYSYTEHMDNETRMKELLVNYSPLTDSVNAVSWQDYIGGIIQHHCTSHYIDHAVQVVGYDMTGPVPYWIVRNTWGTSWGEDGYVRLKFGSNMCGIADEVAVIFQVAGVNL